MSMGSIVAAAALVVAAGAVAWWQSIASALPLAAAAVATVALAVPRGLDPEVAQAAAQGSSDGLLASMAALGLEGDGIYVPVGDAVRLFVPASKDPGPLPPLQDGRTLYRDGREGVGAAFASPGSALARLWHARSGRVEGSGFEGGAHALSKALTDLGLGRTVRVERSKHRVRVGFVPGALADLAWRSATVRPRTGCPATAMALELLAQATGRPVRVTDIGVEGRRLVVEAVLL